MKCTAEALVLFVIAIEPLLAQEPPEEIRATILSIGGEVTWGAGVNGQAVGWSLDEPRSRVTIAARLGNGGGHADADVYLMRQIGPGTSRQDEVAHMTFDLAYPSFGWVTLFENVDLEAGTYWLVVAKPRDKSFSSINWIVSNPMMLRSCNGVRYLGAKSYTFDSDAAEYIPASKFKAGYEPQGYQFELTEPLVVLDNAAAH